MGDRAERKVTSGLLLFYDGNLEAQAPVVSLVYGTL